SLDRFDVYLRGAKVVPPTGSPGIGSAQLTLQAQLLTYNLNSIAVSATGASLREGAVGSNGPTVLVLQSVGGGSFSGSANLSPLNIAKLRAGLLYMEIDSSAFPAGEIRGQAVPSFTRYGTGCAGTSGIPLLNGSGTSVPGGVVFLDVTSGLADGSG